MIEIDNLSKRYGDRYAVRDLSLSIKSGLVTGFLGPNGAGKSTTIRMILGLDRPTTGTVCIDGRRIADIPVPMHAVGALIDAQAIQGGRSAYNHLRALAMTNGIPRKRVEDLIEIVGLSTVAHRPAGAYSLGMKQRMGIAAALLGDPETVILDEPVNGLDPEGIVWVRNLMKSLAREGRTVFVSSHLMSEMAMTADHLVIIGRGELLADTPMEQFLQQASQMSVLVHSPRSSELAEIITRNGGVVTALSDGAFSVTGLDAERIGDLAGAAGIVLHQLATQESSLEDAFMAMTHHTVEYQSSTGPSEVER